MGQLGRRRRDPRRRLRTLRRQGQAALRRLRREVLLRQGTVDHPAAAPGAAGGRRVGPRSPDLRVRRSQCRSRLHHPAPTTTRCARSSAKSRRRRRASEGLRRRVRHVLGVVDTRSDAVVVDGGAAGVGGVAAALAAVRRRRCSAAARGQRDRPALHRRRGGAAAAARPERFRTSYGRRDAARATWPARRRQPLHQEGQP